MPDKDESKTGDNADKKGEGSEADAKDWKAEAEKWKSLSRKHEDQAKANKAELDKLAAEGDTSKSELQKLADRLAAAEKRAEDAAIEGRRFQVAAAKKLTPAQAKRLHGTTLEELEADADDLIEAFKPAPDTGDGSKDGDDTEPKTTGGGKPKERLRPGADTSAEPEETDPRKLAASVPRDRF